jgi:phenylacetate-CoA ligase
MDIRALLNMYQLRRNLHIEQSDLMKMQQIKLRAMIKHAYENVPFYHKKFGSVGIKPEDIKTVADLSKIPTITKSEVQSSFEEFVARTVDLGKCFKRTTSGSTGVPLTIVVERTRIRFEEALWARALSENGLRIRDSLAIIGDPRSFPHKRSWYQHIGVMKRNHISIFDSTDQKITLLEKIKPNAIKSYPSSLAILANALEKKGNTVKPRLIFTTAEFLDNQSRKLISSVFGSEAFDNYASYEFSFMAWECSERIGYHMNIDNLVMEFVDDEEAVAQGESGEIVCTGLANWAMPLIRYRIGDVGVPSDEQCSCGRKLPLMKVVEGRVDDLLLTLDGRLISPTVFFPYPFEDFEEINQFRVIQEKRDRLKIQLVTKEGYLSDDRILEKARKKIQWLFGEGMQVEFQILEKITNDSSGKLRKVISRIPLQLKKSARK